MFRIILIYGVIGAVIVGTPVLWGMLTFDVSSGDMPENGAIIGYTTMLVALTGVFLGVKHYRDKVLGGVVKFWPALGVGLGIGAVASLGWVIAWEISLMATKFDFGAMYSQMMVEQAQAEGASAEKLAQVAKDGEAFAEMYRNPVVRMGITFLDQATKEPDGAKRAELLHQAEALMLSETAVLPLLTRVTQDIVSPKITGYEDNAEDIHRTRYMCRK